MTNLKRILAAVAVIATVGAAGCNRLCLGDEYSSDDHREFCEGPVWTDG